MGQVVVWNTLTMRKPGAGSISDADLLEELISMGIELDREGEYTTEELILQILQILETDKEEFIGTITDTYNPDYGFFGINETIPVQEVTTIDSTVRVVNCTIEVRGEGANTLRFHGDSWTEYERSNNDEAASNRYLRIRYTPSAGGVMTRPMLRAAIEELSFEGDNETPVHAAITLKITTKSGAEISATGTANFNIVYDSTWYLTSLMYPTFGAAIDSGKTWAELNIFDKSLVQVKE